MRLIDADALIAYCDKNWIPLNVDAVNAQPTIDPVKHGRWINIGFLACKCSICDEPVYENGGTTYCPNCGARMDEVTE